MINLTIRRFLHGCPINEGIRGAVKVIISINLRGYLKNRKSINRAGK
jgi:hypothetical protein